MSTGDVHITVSITIPTSSTIAPTAGTSAAKPLAGTAAPRPSGGTA